MKNNKLVLKSQQRFKSKSCNICIEDINEIISSAKNDKRIQSIDSIETNIKL